MGLLCLDYLKRNNIKLFQQKEQNQLHLLDEINLQYFWWLKSKHATFIFDYHLWKLNLLMCL